MRFSSSKLPYFALELGYIALGFSHSLLAGRTRPSGDSFLPHFHCYYRSQPVLPSTTPGAPAAKGESAFFGAAGRTTAALDHTFFNMAANTTTAANAALLGNTAPLWVAICA